MSLKPLGVVREIVESAGMGISYAFEDLVFLEHNAFLLQFTADDKEIFVHTNGEADEMEIKEPIAKLKIIGLTHGLTFTVAGQYRLSQVDDENIRIEFI